MSSYLLSNDEFQTIANFLYMQGTSKHGKHAYDIKSFIGFEAGTDKHFLASQEDIKNAVKDMVRNLYNLNRLALVTRYGDKYDPKDETVYTPINDLMVNERNAINLLIALRYQCSEYLTSDTDLFKSLKQFIGSLCENIFMRGNE